MSLGKTLMESLIDVYIYIYIYKSYSQSTSKHQMQLKVGKTCMDSIAEVRTPLRLGIANFCSPDRWIAVVF